MTRGSCKADVVVNRNCYGFQSTKPIRLSGLYQVGAFHAQRMEEAWVAVDLELILDGEQVTGFGINSDFNLNKLCKFL